MRPILAALLLPLMSVAQTSDRGGLVRLTGELRKAIQNDSLTSAAEIAANLDAAIHSQQRAWLVRDGRERVDEVLSWIPDDSESIWVNQEPFTIRGEESSALLYGRPAQLYSLDRLMALNEGTFYRALNQRTVRLVVATTRGIQGSKDDTISVPAVMRAQDVAYFYFFSQAIELPPHDEDILGRPVWRATAKVDAGEPSRRGLERRQRDDANWIALARPELLILSNRKDLLSEILSRIANGSRTRALPARLAEWAHIDLNSPFCGLRRYTVTSKPKAGQRGCLAAEIPEPDCDATGVTVRFDAATQRLEVRYLSERPLAQAGPGSTLNQFQVDQVQTGVWRLVADAEKRGPFPVHVALSMLGFGMYR
jgi:hypothetical protein